MYLSLRSRPQGRGKAAGRARQRVASTVIVLGLVSMVTDISTESVNSVLPTYLIFVVGLSPQAYGVVNGLYSGVSALVRIGAGWTADRTDHPKWVAFIGYLISALSKVALLTVHTFGGFSAIASADQLGKGIRTAPRDGMIAAASPPEAQGRAFGVHRSLDTFGAFVGPLLAFWILFVAADDFHSVFVASTAFAIVGLAMLLLIVPDLRPRRQRRSREAGVPADRPGRVSLRLVANPRMARLVAAAAMLGLLTIGESFLFLELQDRDNLALKYFPLLVVGMNLSYLLLAIPFGRLADRIGKWRVFIGGYAALVLAYLAAGGPVQGPGATYACLALLGAYYAATDGVLPAMAGQATDPSVRTSAIATAQTVLSGAAFFSSLGFAALWAAIGRAEAMRIVAGLLVCVIPVAAFLLRASERTPLTEDVTEEATPA